MIARFRAPRKMRVQALGGERKSFCTYHINNGMFFVASPAFRTSHQLPSRRRPVFGNGVRPDYARSLRLVR